MRNTVNSGRFRILIYKGNEGFVGICYETGMVDVWPTAEETKKHLLDGAMALMKSVKKGDASEGALNRHPAFGYQLLFLVLPFIWGVSKLFSVSLCTEPINPPVLRHA